MTNLEFIKEFSKIRISLICKKLGIYKNNLYTGKTTEENIKKVKDEIYRQLTLLLMECDKR